MSKLNILFKETAIYGISSIIGRFLNYLLVPLYTRVMPASEGGYGVVTEVYAWTAFLLVILTFGMETTFFRFSNKEEENSSKVYSTTLILVGGAALLFVITCLLLLNPIASAMGYATHPWWIGMMIITVGMDAFQSIPFAYLRYKKKPLVFAAFKLLFIILCIGLNMVYYLGMGGREIGMVFVINLTCTSVIMIPMLRYVKLGYGFDKRLAKRMLHYAYPILIFGIAGILNQVADKMIFKHIYPFSDAEIKLGIYGAAVKIALIMALITQAFRYAYEPFLFGSAKEKDSKQMQADVMKYFIIFTLVAFLAVVLYMDVLKLIIDKDYWEGLKAVPIVMAAEIMMGIYFNLSFWYKLIDQTKWGAWFSFAGCAVLIIINIIFVPHFGYMACAWAGFGGYGTAMLLSYIVGQKKYPINYPIKKIGGYVLLAIAIFLASNGLKKSSMPIKMSVNTLMMVMYLAVIFVYELKPALAHRKKSI